MQERSTLLIKPGRLPLYVPGTAGTGVLVPGSGPQVNSSRSSLRSVTEEGVKQIDSCSLAVVPSVTYSTGRGGELFEQFSLRRLAFEDLSDNAAGSDLRGGAFGDGPS